LLGVKNRADFQKLVGLDLKSSQAFSPELLAAVLNSGVSIQPRRIARYASLGGGVWQTFDAKQAINEFNPLRFLNGGYKHDAEEFFGQLPNGHWAVLLCDKDGKLQDSAPDFIGGDSNAHGNDKRIHAGPLSCLGCHSNGGLRDIRDSVRNVYTLPQVLQTNPLADQRNILKKLLEARQHYFQAIEGRIKRDREVFAGALAQSSGLKSEEYARELRTYFARYDAPLTPERAAQELDTSKAVMLASFDAARKTPFGLDPSLAIFFSGEPLPRTQFNEVYNIGQLTLRGLTAWPK
jgi:hypothetical protein